MLEQASPFTYRAAVNPLTGEHGYDIGRWPAGADLNDPMQFAVVDHSYDQVDAMLRANALNAEPSAAMSKSKKAAEDDDDEVEVTRTTHTSVRRR